MSFPVLTGSEGAKWEMTLGPPSVKGLTKNIFSVKNEKFFGRSVRIR